MGRKGAKTHEEKDIWVEAPEIKQLLSSAADIETARARLARYLDDLEWEHRQGDQEIHELDRSLALQAIRVFRNLISPVYERLVGFSTLEHLLSLARGQEEVSEGFIEEFRHLFRAIKGRSGISKGWLGPLLEAEGVNFVDFKAVKGRQAGRLRSNYLDQEAKLVAQFLSRYPTGLNPEVIAKREENKRRILNYFGGNSEDWNDYRWQLKHIFKGSDGLKHLKALVPLSPEEEKAAELAVENDIPFGITPYYLSLFDFSTSERKQDYQVRSQVMPPMHYVRLMSEHRGDREYYFDFMGEHDTSPADLITRRYPHIAILKAADTCPQICVYCQRNWEITSPLEPRGLPTKAEIDRALNWFAQHPAMMDVLITGGDPWLLPDDMISYIMDRLAKMEHVRNIRWGTRTLVTLPMRVTDELARILGSYIEPGRRNVCVVTHVESGWEITPELAQAVWKLRKQGIYVYNQQVYTIETSRRFQTVATRIAMKLVGIDPYYTFYPKGKEEHKDYLVPIARILQERKEEARLLPGVFRTDEPVFNVPRLGKNHLRAWQDHELIAIRPDGRRVYLFHPWEKGISEVSPWCYTDRSILEYLQEMEQRGEDPEDYESIWYYY